MLTYQEYEKAVFDWLMSKRDIDKDFTFSTRVRSSAGAERDYFIGTEKSNYFGFTLWDISVSYPGSSMDLIDFFFEDVHNSFKFIIECRQTNNPEGKQNESALKLIRLIREQIGNIGTVIYESKENGKDFNFKIGSPKAEYSSLNEMLNDLDLIMGDFIPVVQKCIEEVKKGNPEFKANRISIEDFENHFLKKTLLRIEKENSIPEKNDEHRFKEFLAEFNEIDVSKYIEFIRGAIGNFNLSKGDERLVFNAHYKEKYLSFNVGQRYCLTLHQKNSKGNFGFITSQKIEDSSEQFDGKKPEAWYTHRQNLDVFNELKSLVYDAIEVELKRSTKSGYRKNNVEEFENLIFNGHSTKMNNSTSPLNQILYGPPGTGKTYSTIDMVVDILEPNNSFNREEKKAKYDQLINDNRAFFTTFHQSMSYEEFIEGIKPHTVNDQIRYEVTNGILKDIVEQCFEDIKALKAMSASGTTVLSFKEKFHEFSKAIQLGKIVLKTRSGIPVQLSKTSNAGNLQLNSGEDTRDYVISMKRLEKLVAAFPNPKVIKNIHEEIRSVIGGSNSSLYFSALDAFVSFDKKLTDTVQEDGKEMSLSEIVLTAEEIASLPPYFLIIDEINRGNVSAIFGELITLIEDDKRFGRNNQLFVTLPYSREEFILPPNLYIIGTMNTADRSVEALDTALRRRFSFVEMLPNPSKLEGKTIDGVDLRKLLETMNERIEVLVDRDHTIGHAFLINIQSIDELRNAFTNKIIPLLQEYFYGNYRKMEMVIGSAFFNITDAGKVKFAVQSDDFDADGKIYQILNVSNKDVMSDEAFIQALQKLMSPA